MRFLSIAALWVALWAAACSHDVIIVDQGSVCVDARENQPGPVAIASPCVSACAENVSAGCEVSVDGDRITVSSHFAYDEPPGACIALCGSLEARCELPPLAAGTYTLRHGDDAGQLAVPGGPGPLCPGDR